MEPRPPSASSSILSRWMGIADANNAGNVHGGLIMHLHPSGYVGQLVTVKATVNAAWRTSMEVGNPAEVPPLAPETPDEARRAREAQLRRDTRLAERQRIEQERSRD